MNSRTAFTVVELLVVVAIIMVLLALLAPAIDKALQSTEKVRCAANVQAHYVSVYQYAADQRKQLPPLNDDDGHNQQAGSWSRIFRYNVAGKEWWNLGYLWRGRYLPAGQGFYCPGQQHPAFRYQDYASPTFPSYNTTWDSPATLATGSTAVRLSYNFNPIAISLTNRTHRYRRFDQLDSYAITTVDLVEGVTADGLGLGHPELGGFNVGRGNGSVDFVVDPTMIEDMRNNRTFSGGTSAADYLMWDSIMNRLVYPNR